MSYIYDQHKRPQGQQTGAEPTSAPGPSMDALMSGAVKPTAAQKGRPIELNGQMKAKMENAFGDLSAVKLYESSLVGDAGAEAMAMGNEIAFAPGMADFSTKTGQERLGHELSHVMQRRAGDVRGTGFLADASLESQADREGALAAAGEQVYAGPVTHALSAASPSPMAAGPMQAKRGKPDAVKSGVKQDFKDDENTYNKLNLKAPIEYEDVLMDEEWEAAHAPAPEVQKQKKDVTFDKEAFNALGLKAPIEYEDVLLDDGSEDMLPPSSTPAPEKKKKPWWKFW